MFLYVLSFFFFFSLLFADSVMVNVNVAIDEIQEIAINGTPPTLTPSFPSSSGLTYSITTNKSATQKITALVDSSFPSMITVALSMNAPTGGSSSGSGSLSTLASTFVTNIPQIAQANMNFSYSFTEWPAGYAGTTMNNVTFTITDE